MAKGEMVKGRW